MEKELVVRDSVQINAPAPQVWDALVTPAMTRKFMFDCEAISDWQPGSPLLWRGATDGKVYVKGHIVDIEQNRRLTYTTFDPNGNLEDIPGNYLTVTLTLDQDDSGTVLHVSQGDFGKVENGLKRYEHTVGGWGMTLARLKELVEGA